MKPSSASGHLAGSTQLINVNEILPKYKILHQLQMVKKSDEKFVVGMRPLILKKPVNILNLFLT